MTSLRNSQLRPPSERRSEYIYVQLSERLRTGQYRAGDKLWVEAIRQEFGVSKQPVMDSLRRLSSDGLVSILPQVGCVVREYTAHDVSDFFLVLASLEETIAGLAAERHTPEQLIRLEIACREFPTLSDQGNQSEFARDYLIHNRIFHETMSDMAHSEVMTSKARQFWDLADFMVHTTGHHGTASETFPERQSDHEKILDAIARRDIAAARDAARAHMIHTGQIIVDGESLSIKNFQNGD